MGRCSRRSGSERPSSVPCRRACGVQTARGGSRGIVISDTGRVGERLDRLGQPSAPSVFGAAADEPAADRDPAGDHRREPPTRGRDRQGMGEARAKGGEVRAPGHDGRHGGPVGSRCSRPAARLRPSRPRPSRSPRRGQWADHRPPRCPRPGGWGRCNRPGAARSASPRRSRAGSRAYRSPCPRFFV